MIQIWRDRERDGERGVDGYIVSDFYLFIYFFGFCFFSQMSGREQRAALIFSQRRPRYSGPGPNCDSLKPTFKYFNIFQTGLHCVWD